jgi:hypothetical protein
LLIRAIELVADDGSTQRGQMQANLVLTTGLEVAMDKRLV